MDGLSIYGILAVELGMWFTEHTVLTRYFFLGEDKVYQFHISELNPEGSDTELGWHILVQSSIVLV